MPKNILILGSEGFIGRHCVSNYANQGWNVSGCDLVTHPSQAYTYVQVSRLNPSFETAFKDVPYDICINASGNGSVPVSIEHPVADFEANCGDVLKVLETIRTRKSSCKYLHISSAAVYGNPMRLPVSENDPLAPLSPYGWHKQISETLCREYSALYGLPIAIVRPFSIFGPGLFKQFFWDLHQKCKQSSELTLWGTGNESRDFIYIKDFVRAIDAVLSRSPMNADVYNIASGIETSIADASSMFAKHYNPAIGMSFNHQTRQGDPKNWKANISKITQLGYAGEYSFESGLKETVQWLKGLE